MLDKIWDRATALFVIGLIFVVWFELRGDIRELRSEIRDNAQEVTDASDKTQSAISDLSQQMADVDKAVTVVETVVKPLVPKIEENIRNTDANKDDIERLERLIEEPEGSEP